jgi:hypothetical protein
MLSVCYICAILTEFEMGRKFVVKFSSIGCHEDPMNSCKIRTNGHVVSMTAVLVRVPQKYERV